MEETTTTDAPVEQGGDVTNDNTPQPEQTEQAEAVTTTEPTQESTKTEEPTEETQEDNSTKKWLENKGIDLNSPEAIEKVAEMARNAEKAMHQKAGEKSKLEKALDEGITQEAEATGFSDEDRLDLVRIKTKLSVREFFDSKPDAREHEQAMIEQLQQKPHLAGDLESLYALAVVNSGSLDNIKSQGKQEALKSLAQKQQATAPSGNAVSAAPSSQAITPSNVDQMVARMTPDEYKQRLPEINRALAG